MLKRLQVTEFVIIEKLDLTFNNRLTIITGETGAGKSIILGAMGLILGEPSKPSAIRAGSQESVFDATFEPEKGHPALEFLKERELIGKDDTSFRVHRVMRLDGNDEIKINDKPIEREQLEEIGTYLIEIHGQFANQSLLGPANQLNLLDLSGNFDRIYFQNVEEALDNVQRYANELEEEKKFLARHKGLAGKKVEDVCKKFDDIGMEEGFIAKTKAEYSRLLIAKETGEAFQSILGRLIATNGVVGSLSAANNTLAAQQNVEREKMADLETYLKTALKGAQDAVKEMGTLLPQYEIDLKPLEKLKKILDVLKSIAAEAKIDFKDLEEYWRQESAKRARIRNGRERLIELNDLLIKSKNDYRHHAHVLTEKRVVAGKELSELITAEFTPLMLNKAQFKVEVEEKPDGKWTKLGFNEVTFTARMNPGMPFSPISKTASGGELARMILALKVVLQRVQITPTLVFDEVDTGIGGAAAAAVGDRISLLASGTQVLVITHSAQVASRGDQHLHISKRVEGDVTISSVNELDMDKRVSELSRMLAGDKVTPESDAAARSLITEAKNNAEARVS